MSSSAISALLKWCSQNGIQIDPRVQIVHNHDANRHCASGEARGLCVYSREELIECPSTLVYIPKTAVLSVKSCFFSQHISPVPYGHGAHLSLALALLGELLRGPRSRWFGYLQSLPRETVDIAMFWGADDVIDTQACTCSIRGRTDDDEASGGLDKASRCITFAQCPTCMWVHDSQTARQWLEVTEAHSEQLGLMEEVRQFYHNVLEPTLSAALINPGQERNLSSDSGSSAPEDSDAIVSPRLLGISFPGFCHAYSLVSTRAFWVDAYHGLAMVPIADVFNHTNDNHVQMESDYDVCVECGSFAECEHDREVGSVLTPDSIPLNVHRLSHDDPSTTSEIDYLEMRTVQLIPPFGEIYNTYGSLSNATLLSRYGFTLPENEHDTVRMVFELFAATTKMFAYAAVEGQSAGEDDSDAVRQGAVVEQLEIRNRPRRTSIQDIVNDETRSSLSILGEEPCSSMIATHLGEGSSRENTINRVLHTFTYVARAWSTDAAWDEQDDGLVFNPDPQTARQVSTTVCGDESFQVSHDFVVNSDGKISHNLWLLCILVALSSVRPHLDPAFVDLIQRVENGREVFTWLTEFKARLLKIQGYIEQLRHFHDGESVDGDIDNTGGSNHGSTFPPSFPHLAPSPLNVVDYDTESDGFAQPAATVQVQQSRPSPEAGEKRISVTATMHRSSPSRDEFKPKVIMGQSHGTGPQDPDISSSLSRRTQALSEPSQDTLIRSPVAAPAASQAYQEHPRSSMNTHLEHETRWGAPRDRSSSAEGERPTKRIRRTSDSIVVIREALRANRLGSSTPESAREESNQEVQDRTHRDVQLLGVDHCVALALARIVVGLCRDRYRPPMIGTDQPGSGMTAAELGEILDKPSFSEGYVFQSCCIAAEIYTKAGSERGDLRGASLPRDIVGANRPPGIGEGWKKSPLLRRQNVGGTVLRSSLR